MPRFSENSLEERSQAGARSLERINEENYRLNTENQRAAREARILQQEQINNARLAEIESHHARLEDAKAARQMAMDKAAVDRRIMYEDRMAKAIPELYKIQASDPNANQKRADIASRYPDLFHNEKNLPSLTHEFETHGRLVQAFQLQRSKLADAQATKDAEQAAQTKALANPPAGMHAKSVKSHGVEFQASDADKEKQLAKLEKDFDTGFNKYDGALQSLAEITDGKVPTTLLQAKNYNKNLMRTAAAKLKAANPALADEIDGKIKEATLHEHGLLQTQLAEFKDDKDPKTIETKKRLVGDLNDLKKTLGFGTMKLDENGIPVVDKAGKVITETPESVVPVKPVTSVTPAAPNIPATDDEPLSTGAASETASQVETPENPNLSGEPVGDTPEPVAPAPDATAPVTPMPAAPVTDVTEAPPTAPAAPETPSDITQEDHAKLKPGEKFWWKGKQLTKQ